MISTSQDSLSSSFKSFSRSAGLSALVIGLVSAAGWLSRSELFYSLLKIFGIVQADTAISFALAGLALFLFNKERPADRLLNTAAFCALAVLSISIVSISGYLRDTDIVSWTRYYGSTAAAAETLKMAPTTAMYFLFLGSMLLCLRSARFVFASQGLSLVGLFIGLLNLMGHLYGVTALLSIGDFPQTDLLSTMLFVLLISGGLFSHPEKHIMATVSSPCIGGVIARKLLPLSIGVPVFLGWLRLAGERAGLYGLTTGVTITGLSSILIFTIIIWILGSSLNRVDAERKKAEDVSRQTNEKLAGMVKELEEEGEKNALITEMKDLLQTCAGVRETAPVIKKFIEQLLPFCEGGLFLYSPSRNDLESIVCWGGFGDNSEEALFAPEDCWALRRGRPYTVKNPTEDIICPHVKTLPAPLYFCMPLTAYGEVLGLLHLRDKKREPRQPAAGCCTDPSVQKTVAVVAEHLAVSLANLKLRETLKNQSIRDPLTGLFNRRYMEETLQREIFRAVRKKSSIGVIMVDIDHFKKFNDMFGHSAGDELLVELSKFLQNKIRASDVACRYGGEEFTLFLPDASSEEILKRAEDLRVGAKNLKVALQGKLLDNITISLGIAVFPEHGTTAETLLKVADNALYRAKKEGRDRVVMEGA